MNYISFTHNNVKLVKQKTTNNNRKTHKIHFFENTVIIIFIYNEKVEYSNIKNFCNICSNGVLCCNIVDLLFSCTGQGVEVSAGQVLDPRERKTRDSPGLFEHVNRVNGFWGHCLLHHERRYNSLHAFNIINSVL